MSYKFQKGDAKLGGAVEASALTGTLNPASLADADTDDIGEGSSNLYYTDARARAAVSVTDAGGDGSMAYNSSTGVLTYTGPSAGEVRAHFSGGEMIDLSGGEFSINTAEFSASSDVRFDAKLAAADTDALSEGASNLYYTDARSRAAVSVTDAGGDGSMAYNSSTGVLTYTGPSASEVRAHFSGAAGVDLSSGAISVNVDDSSLEISGDALQVKAAGVTNAMLAGAIADGKLAEDYVQVGEFSGSADAWVATKDTDALSEGASNLYYTDARARAAVSVTDAGGDGSMAYNSSTGVFTYTGPSAAEVRTHFSGAAGVDLTAGAISVNVDDSSLEISGDALQVKALGVTRAMLVADAVDGTKLADDAVDSEHIVDGAVDLAHLAADSVDGTKIADDSVDSEHIVDGAVDNVHLANSTISGKALGTSLDALSQGAGIAAFSYDGSGTATVALSGSVAGEGLVFDAGVLSVAKSLKDVSNSNFNAAYGLNFQSGDMLSPVTGTLPTINSGDEGKSVIIKVRNADLQTVRVQSSQNIDGSSDDLLIESAGAAITLVAISAGAGWAII